LRPFTQLDHVARAVQIANDLQPDLTVLTGDYVWHDAQDIFDLAPVLGQLNARLGVFSILGNHDVWTSPRLIKQALQRQHIPVLHNRGVTLGSGAGQFYLAGIDDGWSGHPDLAAALESIPRIMPTILLAHEPDLADEFALDRRIDLQLSGHTHGGQVQLANNKPLVAPYLGRKYVSGLHRVREMWVYTSRGIGTTGIPLRLNCPPEITHITLTRR
jgi:predicted MPP superfamily phosphohydrolase